jgi:hypothetical protein
MSKLIWRNANGTDEMRKEPMLNVVDFEDEAGDTNPVYSYDFDFQGNSVMSSAYSNCYVKSAVSQMLFWRASRAAV